MKNFHFIPTFAYTASLYNLLNNPASKQLASKHSYPPKAAHWTNITFSTGCRLPSIRIALADPVSRKGTVNRTNSFAEKHIIARPSSFLHLRGTFRDGDGMVLMLGLSITSKAILFGIIVITTTCQ